MKKEMTTNDVVHLSSCASKRIFFLFFSLSIFSFNRGKSFTIIWDYAFAWQIRAFQTAHKHGNHCVRYFNKYAMKSSKKRYRLGKFLFDLFEVCSHLTHNNKHSRSTTANALKLSISLGSSVRLHVKQSESNESHGALLEVSNCLSILCIKNLAILPEYCCRQTEANTIN